MECWLGFIDTDSLVTVYPVSGVKEILPYLDGTADGLQLQGLMLYIFNRSYNETLSNDNNGKGWRTMTETKLYIQKHDKSNLPIMLYNRKNSKIYVGGVKERNFEIADGSFTEVLNVLCKRGYWENPEPEEQE